MFGGTRRALGRLFNGVTDFKQIPTGDPIHFLRLFPEGMQFAGIYRHESGRIDARSPLFKRALNGPRDLRVVVIQQLDLRRA